MRLLNFVKAQSARGNQATILGEGDIFFKRMFSDFYILNSHMRIGEEKAATNAK
jgi:hypothetical protein